MLSGESAMGKFPEEAVMMLAKIATFTETHRSRLSLAGRREFLQQQAAITGIDRMASLVEHALDTVPCDAVLVPTRGGTTARAISRCKPLVWILAASRDHVACQNLAFSYGVHPIDLEEEPEDWQQWTVQWLPKHGVVAKRVMLVAGPSPRNPNANHRIELLRPDTPDIATQ
jgi:pyruvate kinase